MASGRGSTGAVEGLGLLPWEVEKAEAIKVPLGLAHPPCSPHPA